MFNCNIMELYIYFYGTPVALPGCPKRETGSTVIPQLNWPPEAQVEDEGWPAMISFSGTANRHAAQWVDLPGFHGKLHCLSISPQCISASTGPTKENLHEMDRNHNTTLS